MQKFLLPAGACRLPPGPDLELVPEPGGSTLPSTIWLGATPGAPVRTGTGTTVDKDIVVDDVAEPEATAPAPPGSTLAVPLAAAASACCFFSWS